MQDGLHRAAGVDAVAGELAVHQPAAEAAVLIPPPDRAEALAAHVAQDLVAEAAGEDVAVGIDEGLVEADRAAPARAERFLFGRADLLDLERGEDVGEIAGDARGRRAALQQPLGLAQLVGRQPLGLVKGDDLFKDDKVGSDLLGQLEKAGDGRDIFVLDDVKEDQFALALGASLAAQAVEGLEVLAQELEAVHALDFAVGLGVGGVDRKARRVPAHLDQAPGERLLHQRAVADQRARQAAPLDLGHDLDGVRVDERLAAADHVDLMEAGGHAGQEGRVIGQAHAQLAVVFLEFLEPSGWLVLDPAHRAGVVADGAHGVDAQEVRADQRPVDHDPGLAQPMQRRPLNPPPPEAGQELGRTKAVEDRKFAHMVACR